jgi:hypothetical protein
MKDLRAKTGTDALLRHILDAAMSKKGNPAE